MLVTITAKGQGEQVEGAGGHGDTVTRVVLSNLILQGILGKSIL